MIRCPYLNGKKYFGYIGRCYNISAIEKDAIKSGNADMESPPANLVPNYEGTIKPAFYPILRSTTICL